MITQFNVRPDTVKMKYANISVKDALMTTTSVNHKEPDNTADTAVKQDNSKTLKRMETHVITIMNA